VIAIIGGVKVAQHDLGWINFSDLFFLRVGATSREQEGQQKRGEE